LRRPFEKIEEFAFALPITPSIGYPHHLEVLQHANIASDWCVTTVHLLRQFPNAEFDRGIVPEGHPGEVRIHRNCTRSDDLVKHVEQFVLLATEIPGYLPSCFAGIDLLSRQCHTRLAGVGRVIPLNGQAFRTLVDWRARFADPKPSHFVFPSERYGLDGESGYQTGAVAVWDLNPEKPIGSWKVAWSACRKAASVSCRLHDLRHTFVSRLAEAQVADSTLTALSGWMSRKMLERYSHVRNEAKRLAVEMLSAPHIPTDSPQNPPQPDAASGVHLQ
jgi:hypothetical protein